MDNICLITDTTNLVLTHRAQLILTFGMTYSGGPFILADNFERPNVTIDIKMDEYRDKIMITTGVVGDMSTSPQTLTSTSN